MRSGAVPDMRLAMREFPIPMRGNEDWHPHVTLEDQVVFSFPMRGNEAERRSSEHEWR